MSHSTLAAWRDAALSAGNTVFHSSLPFFALMENSPKPGQPDWGEMACFKRINNGEGILTYLSLVDAALDQHILNSGGRNYRIVPFETIDPRHIISSHDNWLTVYSVYGFAARSDQLLTDAKGKLQALSHATHFHIAPELAEHFHLSFGQQAIDWLDTLHRTADIPDYARMTEDLAGSTTAEIERHAQDALRKADTTQGGSEHVTQCALFDTVEGRWRFAAINDLP